MKNIRVGITQGDPNGIGYEIIARALSDEMMTELCTPVIFGGAKAMKRVASLPGLEEFSYETVADCSEVREGVVNFIDCVGEMPDIEPGVINPRAGESAVIALEYGCQALKNGEIDCLVTAPICKESTHSVNFPFSGHTEFLEATLGQGARSLMILCNDTLRVALVSTHISIADIPRVVTTHKIEEVVEVFDKTLRIDFSIDRPRIAVLSLNPHCGDGGLMGNEEQEVIIPAIEACNQKGILAFGPFAADGFFGSGDYAKYDGIVAMYHDQGLAPFKAIASTNGVNFTAGLPYVRTSPDHGTAFGIAWKGEADDESMRQAIYKAIDIFRSRARMTEASSNPLPRHIVEKGVRKEKKQTDTTL